MPDFKVRVKYHEIEVEVILPLDSRSAFKENSDSVGAITKTVEVLTKYVETLIIAGRRDNNA